MADEKMVMPNGRTPYRYSLRPVYRELLANISTLEGRSLEFRTSADKKLQWKWTDESEWKTMMNLSDLPVTAAMGPPGPQGAQGPAGANATPEVVASKVVTAGVAVAVKFAKTYSTPPVVNSRTTWNGQQMVVGQASNITTTGCSVTVMQSRGSLLLSAGPFEPAAAGQSFEILVIGS